MNDYKSNKDRLRKILFYKKMNDLLDLINTTQLQSKRDKHIKHFTVSMAQSIENDIFIINKTSN